MSFRSQPHDEANKMLGKAIKARRIELGESQEKLGNAIGITFQQIQKYEKGANTVTIPRFLDLAVALCISPIELLTKAFGAEASDRGDFSDRATLEMMKRFHDLAPEEQAAVIAFLKTLAAGRRAKAEAA